MRQSQCWLVLLLKLLKLTLVLVSVLVNFVFMSDPNLVQYPVALNVIQLMSIFPLVGDSCDEAES